MNKARAKQRGFLLVGVVFLIFVLSVVAVIISRTLIDEIHSSRKQEASYQALNIANSGLSRGLLAITMPNFDARISCDDLAANYTNVSFDQGEYSLTGIRYTPTTEITLSDPISASDTTIPVTSLNGLAPYGNALINQELLTYRGTSTDNNKCSNAAPCLTQVIRGVGVTNASSHGQGSVVSQNQCEITAQAAVPNFDHPLARRTVRANALQLEEGWAVGNTHGGGETIGFWDGHSWVRVPPDSNLPNSRIAAIAALSYSDIWVVGNSGLFFHWNGNSWQEGNIETSGPNKVSNHHFNDIYCVNSTDCWAVGDKHSSDAFLAHWDGQIWSGVSADVVNENLHGVSCTGPNNCWAVGNSASFLHWDGSSWSAGNVDQNVPSIAINAVSCPNNNYCWAVGGSGTLVHWNGSVWEKKSTPDIPSSSLNNIDCTGDNNCWAVGNNSDGYALLAHWDGNSWQRTLTGAMEQVPAVDLFGISCARPNNCWASGSSGTMVHYDGANWRGNIASDLPSTRINDVNLIASEKPQAFGLWQQD